MAGRGSRQVTPSSGSTSSTSGRTPTARGPSCCSARTRPILERIDGSPNATPYPKDGINDHVVGGADTVNPAGTGTKAAAWYRLTVPAGGTVEVRLRLRRPDEAASGGNGATAPDPLGAAFETTMRHREAEADEFYADLRREDATDDEAMIMRQAFAGMLWSKQYYGYNVSRWLDGDPGLPPPPPERKNGRNADWRHFDAADIMSMPDPWEYPWFAAWDLAFHAVTLAHIDPTFAKYQLLLLCREWFQHPNGALPAYEWSFDDVNPPVHAAAAYLVFAIDGRRDFAFLRRIFHKLLLNFTWWLNRQDKEGNDLFSGGFLGLDNIGAFDRSHLPAGTELEQSDATAWMFQYCINMLRIATVLSEEDPTYEDFQTTFMEHAVRIAHGDDAERPLGRDGWVLLRRAEARRRVGGADQGPFDGRADPAAAGRLDPGEDGPPRPGPRKAVRRVHGGDGHQQREASGGRLRHRSTRSRVPPAQRRPARAAGQAARRDAVRGRVPLAARAARALAAPPRRAIQARARRPDRAGRLRAGRIDVGAVRRQLELARPGLDADQLHGHRRRSGTGIRSWATTSSWSTRPVPATEVRLRDVSEDLARRLVAIWLPDEQGRRPVFGAYEKFQTDPDWHDLLWFHEYFHGDTGAGIGASHQTGWTGLVAHLLCRDGLIDTIASGRGTARMGREPMATAAAAKAEKGLTGGR